MKNFNLIFILIFLSMICVSCSKISNDTNTNFKHVDEISFVMEQFDENNLTDSQSEILKNEIKNNSDWLKFLNSNDTTSFSLMENDSQNFGFYGDKLEWKKNINKSKILSYLKTNNISVANLSDFNLINDENQNTKTIIITNKELNVIDFVKHFKFLSNKFTKIISNQNDIIFYGNGFGINPEINLNFN